MNLTDYSTHYYQMGIGCVRPDHVFALGAFALGGFAPIQTQVMISSPF